ncbi:uncharacterized protein LY79DRAFT_395237 [Colletotrichum navitas]|uniref:Secreted protein n=1 Tax=Colletotrichum navitas TaxID=681940 RepID=A0AAD8PPH1_9PEZI|nr:uncharacterized protein LY79DRAFT_395237 [Colletotrichum navitas]KAK1573916.1 hypothetical protein LY79DRAFT_395237 [Colletotrichum navitas]
MPSTRQYTIAVCKTIVLLCFSDTSAESAHCMPHTTNFNDGVPGPLVSPMCVAETRGPCWHKGERDGQRAARVHCIFIFGRVWDRKTALVSVREREGGRFSDGRRSQRFRWPESPSRLIPTPPPFPRCGDHDRNSCRPAGSRTPSVPKTKIPNMRDPVRSGDGHETKNHIPYASPARGEDTAPSSRGTYTNPGHRQNKVAAQDSA